jgi:hypothetical protein
MMWIRRSGLSWWLLLPIFSCIFLYSVGFGFDRLQLTRDATSGDTLVDHLSAAIFTRYSVLENHAFPDWRATILGGQPFAGISLYKTAYPLQWLVLLFDPITHLNLMTILHLIIAGFGMATWTKTLGLSFEARVFATLAFIFSPKLLAHAAGHFDLLYALAWWPWLASAAKWTLDHPSALNILWTTLFASMQFLADIRLSFFAFLLVLAWVVYEAVRTKRGRTLAWGFMILAGVVILTLPVTQPFLAWSPYISRSHLTLIDAGISSLTFEHLVGLIVPLPGLVEVELITYFGLPVLGLAILALVAEWRKHLFWLIAIVIATVYALGINAPLWPLLVRLFPPLLWFRVPSRAWFILAFMMPMLAGYGLQILLRYTQWIRSIKRKLLLRYLRICRMLAIVFLLCAVVIPLVSPLPFKYMVNLTIGFIFGGMATLFLVMRLISGKIRATRFFLLLMLFTVIDLGATGWTRIQWQGTDIWLEPYQALAQRLVDEKAFRIYSPTISLPQWVAEQYHLQLFEGISPFVFDGVASAIAQGGGFPTINYATGLPPTKLTQKAANTMDTSVLGQWGVTHVIADYPLNKASLSLLDVINGVYIYANRDPSLTIPPAELTHWPESWPHLPNDTTIRQIEQQTEYDHVVSWAGFGLLAVLAVILSYRQFAHERFAKSRDNNRRHQETLKP